MLGFHNVIFFSGQVGNVLRVAANGLFMPCYMENLLKLLHITHS